MVAASLSAPAAQAPAAIATRARRWVVARQHDAAVVLALGAAAALVNVSGSAHLLNGVDSPGMSVPFASLLSNTCNGVVVALVALGLERRRLVGWRRRAAIVVAVVLMAALLPAFTVWIAPWHIRMMLEGGIGISPLSIAVYQFWHWLVLCTLIFAYFARRRAQDESAQRLAALQGEQRAAQRRVAEARLQSLTARVDPRLLFDLLDGVQRAYQTDPPRAERMLDELIVFLRAALSRLHRASSTIAQECELAASYARLLNLAGTSRSALGTAVGSAAQARFPPGLMLPVVEDLLTSGDGTPVAVRAALHEGRCEVQIASSRAPGATALARAREMLALHDGSAIDVLRRAGGFVTTLRVIDERP